MKFKRRIARAVKASAALILVATAVFCLGKRLPDALGSRDTALTAAAFTLTDGKVLPQNGSAPAPTSAVTSEESTTAPSRAVVADVKPRVRNKTGYYDSNADHSNEACYDIVEKTLGADGTAVRGAYVKNCTDLSVDFEERLDAPLTFQVQKNADTPQVLIYHTHTGEAYMDEDTDRFYESFYSRTNNNDFNVVAVGNRLTEALEQRGIKTLHDTTVHDSTYDGSYNRSAQSVIDDMEKYPGIKVVLDIHRDALGSDECKIKTVFEHNGKKGAQMMILSGCDPENERGFSGWQNNLSFALKLQTTAEQLYPGMCRPLDFGRFAYNEYLCDGSLLIEIGTDANSIEEAEYTAALLADVLSRVL